MLSGGVQSTCIALHLIILAKTFFALRAKFAVGVLSKGFLFVLADYWLFTAVHLSEVLTRERPLPQLSNIFKREE